ncbi:MAG: hypothetical protein AAF802_22745 [Planctomycetota bacterium]
MSPLRNRRFHFIVLLAIFLPGVHSTRPAGAVEVEKWLAAFGQLDGSAASDRAAAEAATELQSLPSSDVTQVLEGFTAADVRGKNWLRSVAADVADNGDFPMESLMAYFQDRSKDKDARYTAFQLLSQHDPDSYESLLTDAANDPSLPVRFLKIKSMIREATKAKSDDPELAVKILKDVVSNGRSPAQLETAAKLLSELGEEVDLANELGMMVSWWMIGPFDNTDSKNFDTVYLPETAYLQSGSPIVRDASGSRETATGKSDSVVEWQRIKSDDKLGMVDLNGPLSNEKDAAAYVFRRFQIEGPFTAAAQVRLGCITANKIWINGKLVTENEVYHSGSRIDQYVADCKLVNGTNTVLIKVMQNAQTQPWAQDWQFQFRLTREDGSAIKTTEPSQS